MCYRLGRGISRQSTADVCRPCQTGAHEHPSSSTDRSARATSCTSRHLHRLPVLHGTVGSTSQSKAPASTYAIRCATLCLVSQAKERERVADRKAGARARRLRAPTMRVEESNVSHGTALHRTVRKCWLRQSRFGVGFWIGMSCPVDSATKGAAQKMACDIVATAEGELGQVTRYTRARFHDVCLSRYQNQGAATAAGLYKFIWLQTDTGLQCRGKQISFAAVLWRFWTAYPAKTIFLRNFHWLR